MKAGLTRKLHDIVVFDMQKIIPNMMLLAM